jgi:eukaryotic-like serine/threonine-protein kinase
MKKNPLSQLCLITSMLLISSCNGMKATPFPSPLPTESPVVTDNAMKANPSPSPTELPIVIETRPADGMVMVYIPEGEFTMGSNVGEANEQPPHTVYLDAYWIDKTEVTNAMFAFFVVATGYQTDAEKQASSWIFDGAGWSEVSDADWQHPRGPASDLTGLDNHPVVNVSWNDAAGYCEWAGSRLPSEAEWEKAARGRDERTYPWGNQDPAGNLLNFADANLSVDWAARSVNDGYEFTAPIGSYPAGVSPYGVLDMAGNVWEWVNDWYSETYYRVSPTSNPVGPSTGNSHVLRGGSWNHDGSNLHSSIRISNNPSAAIDNFGFRCSRSIP